MKTIDLLKTFSEPQRLRILNLLQTTDLTVSELVEILSMSQSNVSHHLKILKTQRLIENYKTGNLKFYRSIERPDLPANLIKIWDELKASIKDPGETAEDERKLIVILSHRENNDLSNTINFWRKQQPDLMFSAELALGGIPQHGIALDVGCGNGDFFKYIGNSFKKIIGIDNSLNQLKIATDSVADNGNIILLQSDVNFLPVSTSSVNSVYFRMVLGFLDNPSNALREASRVLKSKGRISIIDRDDTQKRFGKEFFTSFCKQNPDMNIMKYQNNSGLILSVLEKK